METTNHTMNRKSAWIVLAISVLAALPVRLYQIFFLADKNTGFYTDGGTTTGIISICLAVGALLIIVLCALDRKAPQQYRAARSIPTAVLSVLAGLGLVAESLISLATEHGQNYFMYMILSLFGILTGAVLIFTAYDFAVGQNDFARFPLLALVPTLWGCVCLVALFITCVPVVNVSENIYDAFTVIFILLFLFTQAKMFAGVEDVKSSRMIYVFGIPAILFGLVTGISGTAMLLSGVSQAGTFPAGLHLVNFLLALYFGSFLFALRRQPEVLQPDLSEQNEPLSFPEQEPGEPPTMMEWKNCGEFLAKQYRSEEIFTERLPSPYCQVKNENC